MYIRNKFFLKNKAILTVFTVFAVLFILCACNNKFNETDSNQNSGNVSDGLGTFDVRENENMAEHNLRYSNGDYSYHPDINQIEYDYNDNVMYFNDLLIVYTFSDPDEKTIKGLTDTVNGTIVGEISGSVNALQIKVKESSLEELNEMANALMEDENVLFAGYDYPIQLTDSSISDDPWSMDPKKPDNEIGFEEKPDGNDWWAEAIGAYTAWDNLNDVSLIKVGIIDSGFDEDHVELSGKISFLDDYQMNSESDHGTMIAGIIGAKGGNGVGFRGIAENSDLVCVDWNPITNDKNDKKRYVDYLSTGEYIEITKKLIESGVKVINNSWAINIIYSKMYFTEDLYGKSNDLLFLLQYLEVHTSGAYDSYMNYCKAVAKRTGMECMNILIELMLNNPDDFLIVQGAGNGYDNATHGPGYEAEYEGAYCSINNDLYSMLGEDRIARLSESGISYDRIKEHILIVGAVKNEKNDDGYYVMTDFSNFGNSIDICAPGEGIFSSKTNDGYDIGPGTSYSAPMVSGSAALLWAVNPGLTSAKVKGILIESSTTKAVGVGDDSGNTYPMLNLGNAILMQKNETPNRKNYYVPIRITVRDAAEQPSWGTEYSLTWTDNSLTIEQGGPSEHGGENKALLTATESDFAEFEKMYDATFDINGMERSQVDFTDVDFDALMTQYVLSTWRYDGLYKYYASPSDQDKNDWSRLDLGWDEEPGFVAAPGNSEYWIPWIVENVFDRTMDYSVSTSDCYFDDEQLYLLARQSTGTGIPPYEERRIDYIPFSDGSYCAQITKTYGGKTSRYCFHIGLAYDSENDLRYWKLFSIFRDYLESSSKNYNFDENGKIINGNNNESFGISEHSFVYENDVLNKCNINTRFYDSQYSEAVSSADFDARGNLVAIKADEVTSGEYINIEYSDSGEAVSAKRSDSSYEEIAEYFYEEGNNSDRITKASITSTNYAGSMELSYLYDEAGFLAEISTARSYDESSIQLAPFDFSAFFEYDTNGNLSSCIFERAFSDGITTTSKIEITYVEATRNQYNAFRSLCGCSYNLLCPNMYLPEMEYSIDMVLTKGFSS